MADIWNTTKRSEVMSRIRSTGNVDTELRLIHLMRQHHVTGWRRHQPLLGKADFTFRSQRVVVFVDGCFWHGCPKCYRAPTSNETYWSAKVSRNRARDRRVARILRQEGWKVLRVWEHALRLQPARVIARLRVALGPAK